MGAAGRRPATGAPGTHRDRRYPPAQRCHCGRAQVLRRASKIANDGQYAGRVQPPQASHLRPARRHTTLGSTPGPVSASDHRTPVTAPQLGRTVRRASRTTVTNLVTALPVTANPVTEQPATAGNPVTASNRATASNPAMGSRPATVSKPASGQPGYGQGGYYTPAGRRPGTQQIATWAVFGTVALLGGLAAILTWCSDSTWAPPSTAHRMFAGSSAANLRHLPAVAEKQRAARPGSVIVYLIMLTISSVTAVAGAVLLFLRKYVGQFLVLGGGVVLLLFAIVFGGSIRSYRPDYLRLDRRSVHRHRRRSGFGAAGPAFPGLSAAVHRRPARPVRGPLRWRPVRRRRPVRRPVRRGAQSPYGQPQPGQYGQQGPGGYPPRQW